MFADFRIANSQGTAVFRLPTEKFTTTLSKIQSSRTRQSPTSTIIDCRELAYRAREEHRLPDGNRSRLFAGIRKLADSQRESTENSRAFNISRLSPSRLWAANNNRRAGRQYKRSEEPTTLFTVSRLPHHILQIPSRRTISVGPCRRSDFGRANFFHRLLRANVVFSDEYYNVLDKVDGIMQQ